MRYDIKACIDILVMISIATLLDSTGIFFAIVIATEILLCVRCYFNIKADERERDMTLERGKKNDMSALWEDDRRFRGL